MKKAVRGGFIGVLLTLLLLLVLVAAGLLPLNLSLLRGTIEDQLSELLGFDLGLQAPLRVRLGGRASLTVGELLLAGPGPAATPLARVKQLQVSLDTRALLRGEILLHRVRVGQLDADICALAQVQLPEAGSDETQPLPRLALDGLEIGELSLLCNGKVPVASYWPQQMSLAGSARWQQPLTLQLQAQMTDQSLQLEIATASLQNLLVGPASMPVKLAAILEAQGDRLELQVDGTVDELLTNPTLSSSLRASAQGATALLAPYGVLLPESWGVDELSLAAALVMDAGGVALIDLQIKVDELELQGEAGLLAADECASATFALRSQDFDLSFLNRFIEADSQLAGTAASIAVDGHSCGADLEQMLDQFGLKAELANVHMALDQETLPLVLHTAKIAIGSQQPGTVELQADWLDQPLSVYAQTPALLELGNKTEWPLVLELTRGTAQLAIQGSLFNAFAEPRAAGKLQLAVPRSSDLSGWLGIVAAGDVKMGAELEFDVASDSQIIDARSVRLGSSSLQGRWQRQERDNQPVSALMLEGSMLDLTEIEQLFASAVEVGKKDAVAPGRETEGDAGRARLEELLRGPQLRIELDIATVLGRNLRVDDLRLTGTIYDGRVEDAQLQLEYEEVALSGKLDADLRQRPWTMEYDIVADNIDIGRVLESFDIANGFKARAQRVEVAMRVRGSTLVEMVDSMSYQAQVHDLDWLPRALASGDEDLLHISRLELNGRPSARSVWRGTAIYQQLPLDFLLRAPPVKVLLDPAREVDVQFALRAGSDGLLIDARIAPGTISVLDMALDMSAATLDDPGVALEELSGPLDAVRVRTRLRLQTGKLELQDIDLELGSSHILGDVAVARLGKVTTFNAALNSPWLETEDFVRPLALLRAAGMSRSAASAQLESAGVALAHEEERLTETAMTSSSRSGFIAMLNRRIEELTEENHLDLKLNIAELTSAGESLGRASAAMIIDDTRIQLQPLSIISEQGKIEASYLAQRTEDGVQSSLQLDIERLEYGGLLRLFKADSQAEGTLYMQVEATANGERWNDLGGEVTGHLDAALFPLDVEAGILDLWASNLILALLPSGEGESKKKMNCMVSRWTAEDGVMTSRNSFLDSTDIIVRVRGDIDLGRRQLDLLAVPQAKTERFLSVSAPIEVKGTFDDFSVGLAPGSFFITLTRWYYGLIYVPWKWLTGARFPADGIETCFNAMEWELPENLGQ